MKKIKVILVVFTLFFCSPSYALDPEYNVPPENLTPIKSQGNTGSCWAYAGIATLETFLAKNHLFKGSLSEQHLINWASNRSVGWNVGPNSGGTSLIVTGYLASGAGPKFENSEVPGIRVTGIKYIIDDCSHIEFMDRIKQAIVDYGAVGSGYGNSNSGHAISLVGWSDSSKNWIVKDSQTKSYHKLSYSTSGILKKCINYCITSVENTTPTEKIHQHDYYATPSEFFFSTPNFKNSFANVFDFDGKEKLKSVMFRTSCTGAKYTISYAPVTSHEISTDVSTWKELATGIVPYPGYISVGLDQKFLLPLGKGAIVVSVDNSDKKEIASISCECLYQGLKVPQECGLSFLIDQSKTIDIMSIPLTKDSGISALSIKAITDY